MKTIILLVIFVASLETTICVGSSVNNEQEEFNSVQAAFLQFQKYTNKFPTSWDDLWNNAYSKPSVESLDQGNILGRRTDMIESFRFIASGTRILLPGDGAQVVGMMTRPMRPPPETRRRFLIVKLKDGTRGLKQIEESILGKIFASAGFDLADYTGPNGNWAPETRLRPLSSIAPPPKQVTSSSPMDITTIPPLPFSKRLPTEPKQLLWSGSILLIVLIIFFGIIWSLRKLLKHQ